MSINNEQVRMHRLPIYRVALVRETSQSSEINFINNPHNVYEIAAAYLEGADREHFVVMMLDTKNRVIGINTVAVGSLSSCSVHPREVFKPAILANAAGVILVHNHQRVILRRLKMIFMTHQLKEAGEVLGIPVLDHVILGYLNYESLKERGQI